MFSNGLKTKMGATQRMVEYATRERQDSVAEAICAAMYDQAGDS